MSKLSFLILLGVLLSGCTSKQEICRQLGAGMISDYEAYEKLGRPKLKNIGGYDEETSRSLRTAFGGSGADFCRGYMRGYWNNWIIAKVSNIFEVSVYKRQIAIIYR